MRNSDGRVGGPAGAAHGCPCGATREVASRRGRTGSSFRPRSTRLAATSSFPGTGPPIRRPEGARRLQSDRSPGEPPTPGFRGKLYAVLRLFTIAMVNFGGVGPSTGRLVEVCEPQEARFSRAKQAGPVVGSIAFVIVFIGVFYGLNLLYEGQDVYGSLVLVGLAAFIVTLAIWARRSSK